MNIQGYQKLSLLDYPGRVACTVFTGGCNLRCPFCHNAGLVRTPMEHDGVQAEVLEYLGKRRGLLDGVCVTGGEPLLQPDLTEFVRQLKAMGYLVKLDTNGSLPRKLKEVLEGGMIDYVAMDIKGSPEHYARAIGADLDIAPFMESVELIKSSSVAHEFRTTAVKGIHTTDDFASIGKWLGATEAYYIQGFVDSGNLLGSGCEAFSEAEMQTLLQTVRPFIPGAALRGLS